MVPLPSPTCNENWNYERNGDDWVCDCKEGVEQSPIDLPNALKAIESPVKPIFSYKDVEAINDQSTLEGVLENQQKLKIMNVDNMIKILHYDMGKITTVDGAVYNAQEITFHTPSNHQIEGVSFPLEVSIIHYGVTKGDIGKQVVLSFLFQAEPGVYNKFLEDLDYFNLPNSITKKRELQKSLFIPNFLYEVNEFNTEVPIMKPFSFYTYSGSLPFPPCTERTIHYVASKPLRVSTTTIALFKEALRMPDMKSKTGEIFTFSKERSTNRNIQSTNGRPVYWYDHQRHCGPDPVPVKPKKSGHFEKVVSHGTQYFYVGGPEPSGLPGAFVVSEKEAKGASYSPA
jgi:carbonic anhydrase